MHWSKKLVLFFCFATLAVAQPVQSIEIGYEESLAKGIGPQKGVMRRDCSDIIQAGNLYYLWSTRNTSPSDGSGYDATIWYATSEDSHLWTEQGEVLVRWPGRGCVDS